MLCAHGPHATYCGCDFTRAYPATESTIASVRADLESVPAGVQGAVLIHFHESIGDSGFERATAGHYLMWCQSGVRETVLEAAVHGVDRKGSEKFSNVVNVANCKGVSWEIARFIPASSLDEVKSIRRKGQWARKCPVCQGKK